MPLKLVPPKPGKTPNYYIRGTHLGCYVEETTGTSVEALARQFLTKRKRDIESGKLSSPVNNDPGQKAHDLFMSAALSYIEAGGDGQYLGRYDPDLGAWTGGIIPEIGETPLPDIDQQLIDATANKLYPGTSAATRNRQVYTPISAVLKHVGIEFKIRRPKGWRGNKRTDWAQPDQAFRLFDAAGEIDREFRIFLVFLCYTGCRLADALKLTCNRLTLAEGFAYVEQTKNGDPRGVHLPPFLVAEMANHPRGLDRGQQKVFRFRKCGRLYTLMRKAKERAGADVAFVSFHTLCHTWATWMRRYGGLDTRGLVGTGRWRDEKSAARYEHVVVSEEARKADLLPVPQRSKKAKSGENPGRRHLKIAK